MTQIEIQETEEQKLARLQRRRLQMALKHLPDAIAYIRSIALYTGGERGEVLPEWSAPMRLQAADDADAVYLQLIEWVEYWSRWLTFTPPAGQPVAWRNAQKDAIGFRPSTTAEGAGLLTKLQTMWLNLRLDQISAHPAGPEFTRWILETESELRGRYPRSPRPPRMTRSRPCAACGEPAVSAEWFSADPMDVRIACGSCGYELSEGELQDWMLPLVDVDDDEGAADE